MKMSYRQAWELVSSLNKQALKPLVATASGGAGGGGTKITPEGEKVIKLFRELNNRFLRFSEKESKGLKI